MTYFLDQFLIWVASEILLSAILFFSYYALIKRLRNPIDRFNFLSVSFAALLLLPLLPTPSISEPIFRNLISDATRLLQGSAAYGQGDRFVQILSVLALGILPFTYFSVLAIRSIRIFNSLYKLNKISHSGTKDNSLSSFPVVIHAYSLPPMTIGVSSPKILISKDTYQTLSQSELALVIQHEEEHIRRGDGFTNLLRVFVREILLFSPFIWNLANKLEEEMEISVDSTLLSNGGLSARTYGTLLLKMSEFSPRSENLATVGTFLSNSSIKRRLLCMKQISKRRSKLLNSFAMGLFLLSGTLGISLFGTPAYSSDISSAAVADCEKVCVVISSPVIKTAITGEDFQITADLSKQDVQRIISKIGENSK